MRFLSGVSGFLFANLLLFLPSVALGALTAQLEARPDPARPGDRLTIAVHVTNTAPAVTQPVMVQLAIPSTVDAFNETLADGGSCNGGASTTVCERGEPVVWNLGPMAVGESAVVEIAPLVASGIEAPTDGTLIDFVATVIVALVPTTTASASVEVESGSTLSLVISEDRDPVEPGETLAYRFHYGQGADGVTAPGATLVAPIPSGTTFVSASGGGLFSGGQVAWSLGSLEPGETGERELVVDVGAGLANGSFVDANGTLSGSGVPSQVARARTLTVVNTAPAVDVACDILPDPAAPGRTLNSVVTVSNRSAATLMGVNLVMRLPDYLDDLVEVIADGASCNDGASALICERGEQVTWAPGTVTAGETITLTLPPLVSSAASAPPDGELLVFDVYAKNSILGSLASARCSTEVKSGSTLSLALAEDRDPIEPGSQLAYTVSFGQSAVGGNTAPSATLAVPIPFGTSFVSASDGGALVAGRVEWALGDLDPGEAGTRRLLVDVDPAATNGTLVEARAVLRDANDPIESAYARAVTQVNSTPPLELTLDASADPTGPGRTANVLLTVANRGTSVLNNVRLEMRLPDFLDDYSVGLADGASCATGLNNQVCERREQIFWNLAGLDPGEAMTVSAPPIVSQTGLAASDGEFVTFEAIAESNSFLSTLSTVRRSVEIEAAPTLSLVVTEDRDPVLPGTRLDYKLHFGVAQSAGTATSVALIAPLPEGTTFVGASDGGSLVGDQVEWSIGTLAPGATGSRQLLVDVDPGLGAGRVIRARAEISDAADPVRKARAQATTRVEPAPRLAVEIAIVPTPAIAAQPADQAVRGQRLATTVTVRNVGATSALNVGLEMRMPDLLDDLIETAANGGFCNSGSSTTVCERREQFVWSLGTLTAGQAVSRTISPRVSDTGLASVPGQLIEFVAVARVPGTDTDEAVDAISVPEAGSAAMVAAGISLLAALAGTRRPTTNSRRSWPIRASWKKRRPTT